MQSKEPQQKIPGIVSPQYSCISLEPEESNAHLTAVYDLGKQDAQHSVCSTSKMGDGLDSQDSAFSALMFMDEIEEVQHQKESNATFQVDSPSDSLSLILSSNSSYHDAPYNRKGAVNPGFSSLPPSSDKQDSWSASTQSPRSIPSEKLIEVKAPSERKDQISLLQFADPWRALDDILCIPPSGRVRVDRDPLQDISTNDRLGLGYRGLEAKKKSQSPPSVSVQDSFLNGDNSTRYDSGLGNLEGVSSEHDDPDCNVEGISAAPTRHAETLSTETDLCLPSLLSSRTMYNSVSSKPNGVSTSPEKMLPSLPVKSHPHKSSTLPPLGRNGSESHLYHAFPSTFSDTLSPSQVHSNNILQDLLDHKLEYQPIRSAQPVDMQHVHSKELLDVQDEFVDGPDLFAGDDDDDDDGS